MQSRSTSIMDFDHPLVKRTLEDLIDEENSEIETIASIYTFVRDKIQFGYNTSDDIPGSQVLKDGYGQCNTKANLLITLLRATGIEARFHGFEIDKRLQYGAVTGIFYTLTPNRILHSWIEVKQEGNWQNLEGFILDKTYLDSLKTYFPGNPKTLCGYGVATDTFSDAAATDFSSSKSTYIQRNGIVTDLGVFETPDEFYLKYGTNPSGLKKILFKYFVRFVMNRKINQIRNRVHQGELKTLCSISDIDSIF